MNAAKTYRDSISVLRKNDIPKPALTHEYGNSNFFVRAYFQPASNAIQHPNTMRNFV
jgi:hypothetical protein